MLRRPEAAEGDYFRSPQHRVAGMDTMGELRTTALRSKAKVPDSEFHPGERVLAASIPVGTRTTAIDLDVTDGCNLACSYCFKNLDKPNNMTLQTAKDGIEWLIRASADSPDISVNFMGGKPSARFPMLKELVAWGKRRARAVGKRIQFSFTSNMTLWNDEMRRWVDEEGIGVLVSIDGAPETQDAQRPSKNGRPMGETVARWANSMVQTRPQSDGRMTVPPQHVEKFFENCKYPWETVGFINIVAADADYDNWDEHHFETYREQLRLICDYLFDDFTSGGKRSLKVLSYYLQQLIEPRDLDRAVERRNFPCGAGYNYLMIDPKGDIWPCHRFDGAAEDSGLGGKMKMGNIYSEVFNENLSNAFRNFDHSKVFKPACKTCPVEPICGGFCPAANLSDTGSIYTPHDNYCRLKWVLYEEAELLYRRMKDADPVRCAEHIGGLAAGKDV
jgi:uncharacterized protein